MRFLRIQLENWRNFVQADVALGRRVFLVGPNAAGKSNFLDAFRFLRDIADPQGGFQRAVAERGTVSQIRSLHARRYPKIAIEVQMDLGEGDVWSYRLEFTQDNQRRPIVSREAVKHGDFQHERPDPDDLQDPSRLTQTHLEQVSANKKFRAVAEGLAQVRYLHLIPLLVRDPQRAIGKAWEAYGANFLEHLARMERDQPRVFASRMGRIRDALKVAVPQLKELKLERDVRGVPHLMGRYAHWRPNAGWQKEDQFSEGTLRLLGLLWSFLDGKEPLLLEEPELSLHSGVARHIAGMLARLGRRTNRQVLLSTHSPDLLSDPGIPPEEVVILSPSKEGTHVQLAASNEQIRALLESGLSIAEAVLPQTVPAGADQLPLFGE